MRKTIVIAGEMMGASLFCGTGFAIYLIHTNPSSPPNRSKLCSPKRHQYEHAFKLFLSIAINLLSHIEPPIPKGSVVDCANLTFHFHSWTIDTMKISRVITIYKIIEVFATTLFFSIVVLHLTRYPSELYSPKRL